MASVNSTCCDKLQLEGSISSNSPGESPIRRDLSLWYFFRVNHKRTDLGAVRFNVNELCNEEALRYEA